MEFLAGDFGEKPTKRELIDMFKRNLKAGAGRMLELIVSLSPEAISKEDLGAQTGFEAGGGTFKEYFGSLKNNELIEPTEEGRWRAGSAFELARD